MKKIIIISILIFTTNLYSQMSISGSLENQAMLLVGKGYKTDFFDTSVLKIVNEYKDENFRVFADIRLGLLYGFDVSTLSLSQTATTSQSFYFNQGKTTLALDIARLYTKIKAGSIASITVGRSYLNFGESYLFNPLEWYKNFSLVDPLATKPAVNMLAVDIGINDYSKLKMFTGSDDTFKQLLGGVELLFGLSGVEFGVDYQYKGENKNLAGVFFKADMVITLFGSYAYNFNNLLVDTDKNNFSHEGFLGLDYSFRVFEASSLVVQEILYVNSLGAKKKSELLTTPLGDYYFRGFAYSYTSLALAIDEFYSINLACLVNVIDGSGAVMPDFLFNIYNNLSFGTTLAVYFGGDGTEFGVVNNMPNVSIMARLKANF